MPLCTSLFTLSFYKEKAMLLPVPQKNYWLVSVEPKFLLLHMMSAILEMSLYFVFLSVWIKYLRFEILK